MTTVVVRGPAAIDGVVAVPGDKSISHRALMLGAVGNGASTVRNLGPGDDVRSTIACLRAYGVAIDEGSEGTVVHGEGLRSWNEPRAPLDCGNSGTTLRLLTGFAAHHSFTSVFDGDGSLRARPMERLVGPLRALGARVETSDGRPPVSVAGGELAGASVELEMASAQVKSATIFAALAADGRTTVTEPAASRDHTERFLRALGAAIEEIRVDGGHRVEMDPFAPPAFEIDIPGDPSSAAFLVAAALLAGRVRIEDVGLNPTRIGFLETLERMGASIEWTVTGQRLGEPFGWIAAERSDLRAVGIEGPLVPVVLDELPLVAVLATQARGTTVVTGAGELRAKESDRIAAMVNALRRLGADADELPDGFRVTGPTPLVGTKVDAEGDHRIAMGLAVAGLVADGETLVEGFEAATVSWPGFQDVLSSLGAEIELR